MSFLFLPSEDRCHRIGQKNAVNVIYCIDQDESRSIDNILWKMLSKKMNNVGQIIDGKKQILNTISADDDCKLSSQTSFVSGASSKSGENQLIQFFAESKVTSANNTTPVKGSIESFFVKKVQNPEKKSAIVTPSIWGCTFCTFNNNTTSSTCIMCGKIRSSPKSKKPIIQQMDQSPFQVNDFPEVSSSIFALSEQSHSSSKSSWTCTKCTYMNCDSLALGKSCEMCGNKHPQTQGVTDKLSSNHIAIDKKKTSLATERLNAPRAIDLTNDVEGSIDSTDKCIVIDLSPTKHRSSTVNGNTILNFSVSKNSGRIAIHLATGEPLDCNFDLHEICCDRSNQASVRQVKRIGKTQGSTQSYKRNALYNGMIFNKTS